MLARSSQPLARHLPEIRTGLFALALVAYGWFIAAHFAPDAGTADTSGYQNFARLLVDGRLTADLRLPYGVEPSDPFHFTPLGFTPWKEPATLAPTYPVGVPLHLAATAPLLGWPGAATFVGILAATGTLAATWAIGRMLGLAPAGAALAAAAVAGSPMFVFSAIQIMSDALATFWACAAIACALASRRSSTCTRWWPWLCGLATGLAVATRPSNAVIVPALIILLGSPGSILKTAVAGLPFAMLLGWLNQYLYGNPLRTGYGEPSALFALAWVPGSLAHYARWIPALLPLAPAAFLGIPWLPWRERRLEILGLFIWFLALAAFYATYRITHETWWCLRFLLPAFPALGVLGALALSQILGRLTAFRFRYGHLFSAATFTMLLAVLFHFGPRQTRDLNVLGVSANERRHRLVAEWAAANLPPDSLIVAMQASGALYFYTRFPTLRYDLITETDFARYCDQLAPDTPIFAILDYWESDDGRPALPGHWEKRAEISLFTVWSHLGSANSTSRLP